MRKIKENKILEELKPYWVLSPEYGTIIPALDFGQGPVEYGRDCVGVLTLDEQHAKVLGIRAMRKCKDCNYISDDPTENPFAGLEVRRACCKHGTWTFTEVFENGRVNNVQDCGECWEELKRDGS